MALDSISLEVAPAEIFVFVGPNGGGKSTLFRILSTLMPFREGQVEVLGFDLRTARDQVRQRIGVVFQMPSLDKKLTVAENLKYQSALYGLHGETARWREAALMEQLGLTDRRGDITENLSGGLRRRVELAKGMLHDPKLLLLDEPSTGLDPAARAAMWQYLNRIREEQGVTVVLTTHLLEEADHADRIGILDQGHLVAVDSPTRLKNQVGGDTVSVRGPNLTAICEKIQQTLKLEPKLLADTVRLEAEDGPNMIKRIVEICPGEIDHITLSKPSLEDVFIAQTGKVFSEEGQG
ncbi:MAG: ABC transporter ATP-binding protein [Pirellulaceae bacterium]